MKKPSKDQADILEKCTEREFPEFEIPAAMLGIKKDISNGSHFIQLEAYNFSGQGIKKYLDINQFKEFAAGCQAIVEWLRGQENEL